jgi:bacteriocin leader peptide (microcyclamide/patellamide family)
MDKKNLMSQIAQPANRLTIKDLPVELIELSDEALSQVWGGGEDFALPDPRRRCIIFDPDSLIPGVSPYDGEPSLPRSVLVKTLKD